MIRVHDRTDSDYLNNNGLAVLSPSYCKVRETLNSSYVLELSHVIDALGKWENIQEENIIVASTPFGLQGFRINKVKKELRRVTAYAKHIFYDLADNMLLDTRPEHKTGDEAIKYMLANTINQHQFIGKSDILDTSTAYYIRKDIVTALISDEENSFLSRWGGEIFRDNFNITIDSHIGKDYGVIISYGKNLKSIQQDIDMDTVATRVIPVGFDGIMLDGKEPWVDSPLVGNYDKVFTKEINLQDIKVKQSETDEEGYNTLEEAQQAMIDRVNEMYADGLDKPSIIFNVDFVNLANTDEYKDFKELETVNMGDVVTIKHKPLGIDIKAKCVDYEYNCLTGKYLKLTLGDYTNSYVKNQAILNNSIKNGGINSQKLNGIIDALRNSFSATVENATLHNGKAILFEDKVKDSPSYGAMAIGTQGFMIADERTADDRDWKWSTFGTGAGFTANAITTGILSAIIIQSLDESFKIDLGKKGGAQFFNNNQLAMEMINNAIRFYSWFEDGDFIGRIGAYRSGAQLSDGSNYPLLMINNDLNSVVSIGYDLTDGKAREYMSFDKYKVRQNGGVPIIIEEKTFFRSGISNFNGKTTISPMDNGFSVFVNDRLIFNVNDGGLNAYTPLNVPETTRLSAKSVSETSKKNITGKVYSVDDGKLIYDSNASTIRDDIVSSARKLKGLPYVWGGNYPPLGTDSGTDCSGLCQWAYSENGKSITRTTYTQINEGYIVTESTVQKGDLIFSRFENGRPEHVFLYAGKVNGQHTCVEAQQPGTNILERTFTWTSEMVAKCLL